LRRSEANDVAEVVKALESLLARARGAGPSQPIGAVQRAQHQVIVAYDLRPEILEKGRQPRLELILVGDQKVATRAVSAGFASTTNCSGSMWMTSGKPPRQPSLPRWSRPGSSRGSTSSTGYADAELRVSSQRDYHVDLPGQARPDVKWQARAGQGFEAAHFAIDGQRKHATRPMARTSISWTPVVDKRTNHVTKIKFYGTDGHACPSRTSA